MNKIKKVNPVGFRLRGCLTKVTKKGRRDPKFKVDKNFEKQQNSTSFQSYLHQTTQQIYSSPPFQQNNLICHHNQEELQKASQHSNLRLLSRPDNLQNDFRQLNSPPSYDHNPLQHSCSAQPPNPEHSLNDNESDSFSNLQMENDDFLDDNSDMGEFELDNWSLFDYNVLFFEETSLK